jgi:hypothetical protein
MFDNGFGLDEAAMDKFLKFELMCCAFDVLHDNPGCDYSRWREVLLKQYPAEVCDALGTDALDAYAQLAHLWHEVHVDEAGIGRTLEQWAFAFSSSAAVELYDELIFAKKSDFVNVKKGDFYR